MITFTVCCFLNITLCSQENYNRHYKYKPISIIHSKKKKDFDWTDFFFKLISFIKPFCSQTEATGGLCFSDLTQRKLNLSDDLNVCTSSNMQTHSGYCNSATLWATGRLCACASPHHHQSRDAATKLRPRLWALVKGHVALQQ